MIPCPKCGHRFALPANRTLTKRQAELMKFLREYLDLFGFAPTFQEIAEAIGVSSLATVYEHLNNLELKGYISRRAKEERAISIIATDPAPAVTP